MPDHSARFRVYYEDTDAGGIVYHANYLRWMERVRTDWLRALGVNQGQLAHSAGIQFVVSALDIRYIRPARLDDQVVVDLTVAERRRASLRLTQQVRLLAEPAAGNDEQMSAPGPLLAHASVRVAVMDRHTGRPAALPHWLLNSLERE